MKDFKATVRFVKLNGADALTVRHALEERLTKAGLSDWRVVEIHEYGAPPKPARSAVQQWKTDANVAGKLFVMGAAVWALWFFWVLAE